MMTTVAFVAWLLMDVAQIVNFLEMNALLFGVSAPMCSIYIALSNGYNLSLSVHHAQCVDKSGNGRQDRVEAQLVECGRRHEKEMDVAHESINVEFDISKYFFVRSFQYFRC